MNDTAPTLSVVVIGRNEGVRLQRCLASVRAMEGASRTLECMYVDSGSVDRSLAIATAQGFRAISLDNDRSTAARGRNAGWRVATGEFVLFLDGDTILDPHFVSTALPAFADPAVAVVWGHRREFEPEASVYNRVLDLDWIYAPGRTPFCGGDALFRRDVLLATGGFNEALIAGEEPELCRRILATGSYVLHIDVPMTLHDLAIHNAVSYWRRAERAGHAYAEVAASFRRTGTPFWEDEVRRNLQRALILAALPIAGLAISVWWKSPWPLLLVVLLIAALAVRTAWKARWKSSDATTLLLYGVHSHLQQIPIAFGQLRYARNRRRSRSADLLEYK